MFSSSENRHVELLALQPQSISVSTKNRYERQAPEQFRLMEFSQSNSDMGMLSFSDGMASFSVFWEPAEMKMPEASYEQGATRIISVKKGDRIFTLIGEIPKSTALQILQDLEV